MIDYFSYLLLNKIVLFPLNVLQFTSYEGQLRTSFGVFVTASLRGIRVVCKTKAKKKKKKLT